MRIKLKEVSYRFLSDICNALAVSLMPPTLRIRVNETSFPSSDFIFPAPSYFYVFIDIPAIPPSACEPSQDIALLSARPARKVFRACAGCPFWPAGSLSCLAGMRRCSGHLQSKKAVQGFVLRARTIIFASNLK
ncbi:MAG: hypothetical protein IJ729_05005 [Alloprevotella sp.]|nr:hypothetical protein [Alloprevotella sp.]